MCNSSKAGKGAQTIELLELLSRALAWSLCEGTTKVSQTVWQRQGQEIRRS